MTTNTLAITPKYPLIGAVGVTAANTSSQGGGTVGTDIFSLVAPAGTDGIFVKYVMAVPTSTTSGTATTSSVARFFISQKTAGQATATGDTHNIGRELNCPTQSPGATTPASPVPCPMNLWLPSGWGLLVTMHHAPAANTVWKFTAFGGDLDSTK